MSSSSAGSKGMVWRSVDRRVARPDRRAAKQRTLIRSRWRNPPNSKPARKGSMSPALRRHARRRPLRCRTRATRWQDGRLSSRGEFAALLARHCSLLHPAATRLSSTLTTAGHWSFAATPESPARYRYRVRPATSPESMPRIWRSASPCRAYGRVRRRSRACDIDRAIPFARRRAERRPRPVARIRAAAFGRLPLRLSARVDATSLRGRTRQSRAGTAAIRR